LKHPQIRTQAKLQRRPPLIADRPNNRAQAFQGGQNPSRILGRMYCSHLLSAASVLHCRWLYYTQEDANGMYEGVVEEHANRASLER
jgi:hypothetical protein